MTFQLREYQLDVDFAREQLQSMSWAVPFFTDTLPLFRWSGLSGMALDRGDVSMIGFVHAFQTNETEVTGFSVVAVRKGDAAIPPLFAIPLCIKVEADAGADPPDPGTIGAAFQFKNGTRARIKILINDLAFWKRLGKALLVQSIPQKDFLVDILDPGFSSGVKSLRDMPDDEGVDPVFLGGGDTTNIVIKFRIPSSPGLDFVLKFYPRIAFNTARYLNDMLASAKFHHFARLVATCDYQMETMLIFFCDSAGEPFFNRVKLACASLNIPVNRFFPFIHMIQFIPGHGDGGMPFWNSAISQLQKEGSPPDNDIVDIATKLGKTVAEFHQALQGKAVQAPKDAAIQLQEQIRKLEDQFKQTSVHLTEYQASLPLEFSQMISGLLQMLDFQAIVRKAVPDEAEYQKLGRQYIHQDLHMGQLMFIDALKEFSILDLEGDPQLPWNERLECSPVERDLASLVRSLSYIKIAALRNHIEREFKEITEAIPRFNEVYPLLFLTSSNLAACLYSRLGGPIGAAIRNIVKVLNTWEDHIRDIILITYEKERPVDQRVLLFYTLQRIMNEITYEIKFRPTNFLIPCVGLLELAEK
jgi:hypothetical protein